MSGFDTIAVVDWSAANDRGAKPVKDAIWAAVARAEGAVPPVYLRNRSVAGDWLGELCEAEASAGRRALIAFDFPFGYPAGFAQAVAGKPDPLALWDWFATRLEDQPHANNRFALAGEINGMFPGIGPFWFNGTRADVAGLPRLGRDRTETGLEEKRNAEQMAKGAFTCWQMGGPGSVGGQTMTGMAALSALRARLGSRVRVWPFEDIAAAPVVLAEIWPSLIDTEIRSQQAPGEIRDAAQVRVLANTLWRLDRADRLGSLLADVPDAARREEGWILGLGHEKVLAEAAGPRVGNDCFALPPGVNWMPVDEALSLLRDGLKPVTAIETLPLAEIDGRRLAYAPRALRANPPGANAAVDGYGFAQGALTAGAQYLPLVAGRAAAGAPFDGTVPAGQAVRILTGALLPAGVDTVVLQEDCRLEDDHIAFDGVPKAGANTRRKGEDVEAGVEILTVGQLLRPPDLALAAAVGIDGLAVHAPLRVAVLSTGDELAAPGDTLDPVRTFDANRPMLLALARRWGHETVDLGRIPDDRAALRAALDAGAARADVILTSGGASAGDEDHVSALLGETGSLRAWRIALKPGRPLALGVWSGAPVFGLPGNPVAALVCALIFARPTLSVLAGGTLEPPMAFDVPAAFEKRKKPGRREYLRARLRAGRAEIFASEGSGRISGLSWADGLVELSEATVAVSPGEPVRFLPYAGFGL